MKLVIFKLQQFVFCLVMQTHKRKQEKEQSPSAAVVFFPLKLRMPLTTFHGSITEDKAGQTFPFSLSRGKGLPVFVFWDILTVLS